jgi:hypothetical protein
MAGGRSTGIVMSPSLADGVVRTAQSNYGFKQAEQWPVARQAAESGVSEERAYQRGGSG